MKTKVISFAVDEAEDLADIPIDDRIVMDTGCSVTFLLRFIHGNYVKDLQKDGTIDIQTINEFKRQPAREGTLSGMRAVINGTAIYSLFGVGPLLKALTPHGACYFDETGFNLLYKGNVFYKALVDQDGIPWGSLKGLVDSLYNKSIQQTIRRNNIKCFVTLRSRTDTTSDGFSHTSMVIHSHPANIRRSNRPRVTNTLYQDYVKSDNVKGVKSSTSKKSKSKGKPKSTTDIMSIPHEEVPLSNVDDHTSTVDPVGGAGQDVNFDQVDFPDQEYVDVNDQQLINNSSDENTTDLEFPPVDDDLVNQTTVLGANAEWIPDVIKTTSHTPLKGVTVHPNFDVEIDHRMNHEETSYANRNLSKGERRAAIADSFLCGLTEATARRMINHHKELGFTLKDHKSFVNKFSQPLQSITTLVRTRRPHANHKYTSKPGEIICIDPKQVGGTAGQSKIAIVPGICQVTGYIHVVYQLGSIEDAWKWSVQGLKKKFKATGLLSHMPGHGEVKEIWSDADPEMTHITEYLNQELDLFVSQAEKQHYQTKVEASIQQIDNRLARILIAYPVEVPDYLATAFWIAQSSIHNLIIQKGKKLSPYEQFTHRKVDFSQFSMLPVGQLVAYRVSASTRLKRPAKVQGQIRNDSMVGKPRGTLGLVLGYCEMNPTCRWVLPLSDNMNINSINDVTYTSDMTPLPMKEEFFPPSFNRKISNSYNRVYNSMYWMHWEKERESHLLNTPFFPESEVNEVDEEVEDEIDEIEKEHEEHREEENENDDNKLNVNDGSDKTVAYYQDNDQNKDSSDYIVDDESYATTGMLGSLRSILGLYTSAESNTIAEKNLNYRNENDVIKLDGVKFKGAIILITQADMYLFKRDLSFTFGDDVWLELIGNDYWTNSVEVFEAEEYKSDEQYHTQVNQRTGIEDYIRYKVEKEKGRDVSLNIQEEKLITTNTFFTLCLYSSAPMSPREAAKQPKALAEAAKAAIQDEKNSLIANGVIEAIKYSDIPEDKRYRILRSFTFVTNKFDSHNKYTGSKARHVIDGSKQPKDTYNWTASPVVSRPCVYLLLLQSLLWNNNLKTMDVTKAFQIPDENEELYIRMEKEVFRLKKSLYGCKHASWNWYIHLRRTMIELGFTATQYDGGTLSYVHEDTLIAVIAMHVDDILITWHPDHDWIIVKLEEGLRKKYKITTGDGTDFLGLSIKSGKDYVYISQPGYFATLGDELNIEDSIAKSFNTSWSKDGCTPWPNNVLNTMQETNHDPVPIKDYQKLIGLLNYAALLRTDIQPMVNKLSSHQVKPLKNHYKILVRICWYLRNTSEDGLKLSYPTLTNGKYTLWASCDASYNNDDGKSQMAHTVAVGCDNGPILASCRRNPTVCTSSADAELKGFTYCAQNVD